MYLCDTIQKPEQCVINDIISIAEKLSVAIGVYMCVDLFVTGNQVLVQEYLPNPMNGLYHCASKTNDDGCIDSCFVGCEWKAAGVGLYGVKPTKVPDALVGFLDNTSAEQCVLRIKLEVVNKHMLLCGQQP